jgi:CopG family transcriptional regulator, nickel-responsive regulator
MSELIRFGVSIDDDLLVSFDQIINDRGYSNRSEAIRDLIRDALIQKRLQDDSEVEVLGSLTLIYDHHATTLLPEMAEIQHKHHNTILSVMHLHVTHLDCMEIIALRGIVGEISKLSNSLLSLKGIKHGKLFLTLPSSGIAKV